MISVVCALVVLVSRLDGNSESQGTLSSSFWKAKANRSLPKLIFAFFRESRYHRSVIPAVR